jgi:polar amino acid transport system substrate-binding protein
MIVTRHDTHADSVVRALRAGKHVYVEKPLALTEEECRAVHEALQAAGNRQLLVGFNRRFAPLVSELQKFFSSVRSPLVINIRVNAGPIPPDHWIQNPSVGGGRLIGEGCHFIDLASAIAGCPPEEVHCVGSARHEKSALTNDNVLVSLRFTNGAIASIAYTADGSRAMPKEHIEVFGGGRAATIKDFSSLELYDGDMRHRTIRSRGQDKGQEAMLLAWLNGLRAGVPCLPVDDIILTSRATIRAVESLMLGMPLRVQDETPLSSVPDRGEARAEDRYARS